LGDKTIIIINKVKLKNQKNLIKSSYGFSIIELMVVVIILSLIILGLVSIFSGGMRSWVSGESQLEAQRNARQAMDRMVRELRLSERVIISQDHKIKTSIPDLNGTGGPGYYVTYYLDGDSVKRKTEIGGPSSTNILIDDVLNLDFTYPKSSRVNILLEIDVDHDNAADISLNTAVNFRNF